MPVGISYRAMLAAAGSSAAADAYIVNTFSPPVVADFAGVLNSGTPYFRVGGSDSSFASMFTFARSSTAYYRASDGTLTQASSGTARKDHYKWNGSSWVRAGILLEGEARTNLITSSDDMSGWTTSNMTVAKNQTGADGVANSAHSLTATSGSATVLTTITAASNPHVYSALVKRVTGTGTIEMTVNGGTNWINVTSLVNSSEFIQVGTGAGTTVTNPQVGFRITTSGDAIAVQVNQLEQTSGQFSSPIPTSGTTVTRATETLQIDSDAWSPSTTAMSYNWQGTLDHYDNDQVTSLFSITNSSANWLGLDIYTNLTRTGFLTFQGDYSNSYVGSSTSNDYVAQGKATPISAAARMSSTVWQLAEGGTALTDAGRSSSTPDYTGDPIILGYGSSSITGKRYSNQTIEMFRQWDDDIGETGIESATS